MKKEIVFACTGNASRSAVAEIVLQKMLADNGTEGVEVSHLLRPHRSKLQRNYKYFTLHNTLKKYDYEIVQI